MKPVNPFVDLTADCAKQLLLDLQGAVDALAELPGYSDEAALLMRCLESAYIEFENATLA